MQRDLAQALMNPQSGGVADVWNSIAAYVQECVHSTTVGMDATFVFLMQLIEELDDATAEFLPPAPTTQPLPDDHELELGTLLSAASLAMVPLLQRYRDAFATVLHYPSWQRKSYFGLKAVALMGCTRVLESFGEQVPVADVLKQMRWLFPLFQTESTPATDAVQRMNALLRPACEYVAVALQTHPAILPQLLSLLIKEGAELQDTLVEESVQVELATTVAVLLEAKFPYIAPNPFALLPLPAFVEEMEADDASGSAGGASSIFTPALESTAGKMETVDEEEAKPAAATIALEQEEECGQVLCTWLQVASRRMVAAQALAVLYRVIAESTTQIEPKSGMATDTRPLDEMTSALNDCALLSLPDFEFVNALLESIRDICLCKQRLLTSTLEAAFQTLSGVMSRLEVRITSPTALSASSEKHVTERRAVKSACSMIRHTLVEAFLAWLHHPGATNLVALHVEFLHNVAGTLADPRVYGDGLLVLRAATLPEARVEYHACRQLAVVTLCQAIDQLDRYSKVSANRIISGLTRIAAACHQDIHPLANELVLPLLPSMLDGSQWGKFLRIRTEAVATVLLGCAEGDEFRVGTVENHPWIGDFIGFLLDPIVSSENVHSLMVLSGLIRAERKLLLHVVSFCMTHPHTVTQTLHEPLSRWPLYEEDVELVVVTLELLESLLRVDALRATVDVDVIYATILQLSENAGAERLDAISAACTQVLTSLGSQ
ncbi:hypothetical protein BBJ28_00014088 [Nothophytophthora sp. Chile5]|nr:hypothetical protein BBJ28_00014088 [Nothophytophthora sp. Chile5]